MSWAAPKPRDHGVIKIAPSGDYNAVSVDDDGATPETPKKGAARLARLCSMVCFAGATSRCLQVWLEAVRRVIHFA